MSTADVTLQGDVLLHLRLKLPESVVEAYEAQARASGRDLDDLIAQRLSATVGQNSVGPVYLDDAQRKALEQLLKMNFRSPEALVGAVSRLSRVKVGRTNVQLDATLNERLRSRCPRNEPFESWLENQVLVCLQQIVGLR